VLFGSELFLPFARAGFIELKDVSGETSHEAPGLTASMCGQDSNSRQEEKRTHEYRRQGVAIHTSARAAMLYEQSWEAETRAKDFELEMGGFQDQSAAMALHLPCFCGGCLEKYETLQSRW
jgi:hypothetical protein